ncbi:MAG: hypothetical protein ACRDXX_16815 [Stackebrandtia sp.]
MELSAFVAIERMRQNANSAMPDAPVVEPKPRRVREAGTVRRSAAGVLRRAANRLEPSLG